jgi:hypothetical protein
MLNRKVIGWKIWYTSGKTLSSLDDKWSNVPSDGVVSVAIFFTGFDPNGNPIRRIMSGHDWYFSDGDQLFAHNSDELNTNRERYPGCTYLRGKWTNDENYHNIMERTMAERELV